MVKRIFCYGGLEAEVGRFDDPAGSCEGSYGLVAGAVGELDQHSNRAVAKFDVGGVQIDHEVADDLAGLDHGEGGDHVEDELGGGAGFETGGAGENLWAEIGGEDEVGLPVGISELAGRAADGGVEANQSGVGLAPIGLVESAPDKRGAATGCDANDDVVGGDLPLVDGGGTGLDIVLRALDGAPESLATASDDALDLLARGAEGGWDFAGVEHAEATAGAGSDIDQATALGKGAGDFGGEGGDGALLFGEGGGDLGVFR